MRTDMAKVIVERPRYGSRMKSRPHKGYERALWRLGHDGKAFPRSTASWAHSFLIEYPGPLMRCGDCARAGIEKEQLAAEPCSWSWSSSACDAES